MIINKYLKYIRLNVHINIIAQNVFKDILSILLIYVKNVQSKIVKIVQNYIANNA